MHRQVRKVFHETRSKKNSIWGAQVVGQNWKDPLKLSGPILPGLRYKSQGPGRERDSLKYITWPWQTKSQS